jgi:hypothetical protein
MIVFCCNQFITFVLGGFGAFLMIERWTFAPMRGLLQASVALLMLLVSAPAQADTVPGMVAAPERHLSYDPSPVTVRFLYNDGTRDLLIPRKYIVFAEGKHSSRDGPIPDFIETRSVKLVLTYPDGEAWSVATRVYMQEHAVGHQTAAAEMRDRMHIVQATNNFFNLDIVRQDYYVRTTEGRIGEVGLIEHFVGRGSQTLFIGNEEEEFLRVRRYDSKNSGWFCKYDARLTANIVFRSDFVEFRLFGGVDFGNNRIRMIKRTLCSFTESC